MITLIYLHDWSISHVREERKIIQYILNYLQHFFFSQMNEIIVSLIFRITFLCNAHQSEIELNDVYPRMIFNQVANLHVRVASNWQCPITINFLPHWKGFKSINIMMTRRKENVTVSSVLFVLCVLRLITFYDKDLWQAVLVPNWYSYRYFSFSGICKNWSLLKN